jgi:virginiamycin B lyase
MKRVSLTRAFGALSLALLLSGCGRHNSLPSVPNTLQKTGTTHATLVVKIPKNTTSTAARRPSFISPSTKSISFAYKIGTTTYPAQAFDVTPQSPGCTTDTSGNTTCTLSFGAFSGDATYTVTAYDSTGAMGNVLAAATGSLTIVAGQDNTIGITLDGAPTRFALNLAQSTVTKGTPSDIPLTVSAYDSDGNLIVNSPAYWSGTANGTYNSVTIATSDAAEFSLQQNGSALQTLAGDPNTYQIAVPFSNLSVHYSGTSLSAGTLTLSDAATGLSDAKTITVQEPAPTITEYAVPVGYANAALPWGIATDSNGRVWFANDNAASSNFLGTFGNVAADGSMQMFDEPAGQDRGMAFGPDGNLWMTGECYTDGIDVFSTSGAFIANYQLPSDATKSFGDCTFLHSGQIVSGSGGDLWFVEGSHNRIGRITTTGTATEYTTASGAFGITLGPDGNMWFTENGGEIGMITAAGAITQFTLPSGVSPRYIASGIDGNLWFTATVDHAPFTAIGKLTPSGTYTEYDTPYTITDPSYAGPSGIFAGPDGNLWYGDDGLLGRVDPNTGTITTFSSSSFGCGPNEAPQMFTATDASTVWFTDNDGCIGKIAIQ